MDILVEYNTFEAKFMINNTFAYQGIRTTQKWRYLWQLFDSDDKIVAEIKLRPYIIKLGLNEEYRIHFNGLNLILHYKAFKATHYTMTINNDLYKIIVHKGNQLSFFKNEQQFAALTGQPLNIGMTKQIFEQADNDVDIKFLSTLIYAIKCTSKDGNDGSIHFNLGNVGPELKKPNTQWTPKLI